MKHDTVVQELVDRLLGLRGRTCLYHEGPAMFTVIVTAVDISKWGIELRAAPDPTWQGEDVSTDSLNFSGNWDSFYWSPVRIGLQNGWDLIFQEDIIAEARRGTASGLTDLDLWAAIHKLLQHEENKPI